MGAGRRLRVATRKSPLAMRQTELAIAHLAARCPDWDFDVIPMSTTGDERLNWSLETSGGKGLFTSALEEAMVRGEADLAVHSAKDLPTDMPDGLALAGYLPRAAAWDVLVIRESLSEPRVIATSSPRRRAQLAKVFPKAEWVEIRGNIQTRLRKIAEGEADASIMAMAGFHRMGLLSHEGLRFVHLPLRLSVPAAGQGAIGLQLRSEDAAEMAPHLCPETHRAVTLERAFLAAMGGGCHSATAAHYVNETLLFFDEADALREIAIPSTLETTDPDKVTQWAREQLS